MYTVYELTRIRHSARRLIPPVTRTTTYMYAMCMTRCTVDIFGDAATLKLI